MIIGYDGTPCYLPSDNCDIDAAYLWYRPSLSVNVAFLVLFGISLIAFVIQGAIDATWLGFSFVMAAGCALEVVGYIGRVLAHDDMFAETPFLIQIVCLTIAPAFLAAGIYLCLFHIVTTIGPQNSRIKPLSYPKIFIPCDLISLVLQAIGGAVASAAVHRGEKTKKGDSIMIAGLTFQVATMFAFILLSADFGWRTFRNRRVLPLAGGLTPNQCQTAIRNSRPFKAFLIALALSTLCIFTRCVFRVAELSEGWRGHLATTQRYFIGLEGAVVVASVLLLNLCHPALSFKDAKETSVLHPARRIWFRRNSSNANSGEAIETELARVTTVPPKQAA